MAKKKKTENVLNANNEIPEVTTSGFVRLADETPELTGTITTSASSDIDICLTSTTYNTLDYSSMTELMAYDEACRMICGHYDREMKLNELERRNYTKEQINFNRGQYNKFVNIHNHLRSTIENKLEKLAENENW